MQIFTRWVGRVGLLGWLLALRSLAWAQYTTATPDGIINAASEYHNNQFVTADAGTPGGSWYLSWDAATVYLAKTNALNNQPCYVYFDLDPVQPVTDSDGRLGGAAHGNLNGYVSTGQPKGDFDVIPQLPFRADARLYFQDGYVGVSRRDGSGNWLPTTAIGTEGHAAGNREVAVPWDALTGGAGRPGGFNFFAYQTNRNTGSGNLRYDLAPTNAGAVGSSGGTAPAFENYFTVLSTADGVYPAAQNATPFARVSFSARPGLAYSAVGSAHTWDFTLDYSTSSITRASSAAGTDWSIDGTLTVSNGTLTFGDASGSGTTTVGGLLVTGGGVLDLNQTTHPLSVTAGLTSSVLLRNGGQLLLSRAAGGDLNLRGDFTVQDGATRFQPNGRTVSLSGLAQVIAGPATRALAFDHLTLAGSDAASTVQLKSDITVLGNLTFTQGQLLTVDASTTPAGTYGVRLRATGQLVGERAASALTGYVSSRRAVGAGGTGTVAFGNLGLVLTPVGASVAPDSVTVTRSRGLAGLTGPNSATSIQRNYRLVPTTALGSYDVNLALSYFDSELNGLAASSLLLLASLDALTGPAAPTGTFAQLALNSLDPAGNLATRAGLSDLGQANGPAGMVYTLGTQATAATPLPVQLVHFAAARAGAGAVQLAWRTASEVQNAGFGVERQQGGGPWVPVAFVAGQGTAQGRAYGYLDATAPTGTLYYRLRQTDLDGTASYSAVVAVAGAGEQTAPGIAVSPVPAPADQATITIDLHALPAAARTLAVYDLQGRLLVQDTASAEAATAVLPVRGLAAGTYLVLVQSAGGSYRTRFSKL